MPFIASLTVPFIASLTVPFIASLTVLPTVSLTVSSGEEGMGERVMPTGSLESTNSSSSVTGSSEGRDTAEAGVTRREDFTRGGCVGLFR